MPIVFCHYAECLVVNRRAVGIARLVLFRLFPQRETGYMRSEVSSDLATPVFRDLSAAEIPKHRLLEAAVHLVFRDRDEAGRRLAGKLSDYRGADAVIGAIPRGGIPVAAAVAHVLQLDWGVIVVRKLPIPWSPEAGFGAVAEDGAVVLNEAMVHGLMMSRDQIDEVVREVRAELARRAEFMLQARPLPDVTGRFAIVIDDGLASGYTMLAAIKSLKEKGVSRVVAAAPVASRSAAALVGPAADECIFEIVSPSVPFAVADFYINWHDLTDEEIAPVLEW